MSEEGARMGYTGKQVIHPNQVPIVRQAFSPSPERVKWATGLIEAFHDHQKSGKVSTRVVIGCLRINFFFSNAEIGCFCVRGSIDRQTSFTSSRKYCQITRSDINLTSFFFFMHLQWLYIIIVYIYVYSA